MDNVKSFKISVIIPTYNRAHLLKETLQSVIDQTHSNWECVVVDDGSKDNTEALIEPFLKDPRFTFIERPPAVKKGASVCRNIGIDSTNGDYYQFLDSDDLLAPNKFEEQLEQLASSPRNFLAICNWGSIKPKWKKPRIYTGLPTYLSTSKPLELLKIFGRHSKYLPPHTYLIPKAVLKLAGRWNEDLELNQDGEFFTRIILNSDGIKFCGRTYVLYRTGSGDRISNRRNTETGIKSYIKSWNLINMHIIQKKGKHNHIYVRQAKKDLFERLKKDKSPFLSSEKEFFKNRTSHLHFIILRITQRLRDKLSVKQIQLSENNFRDI